MSNYFSDFISRFLVENLGISRAGTVSDSDHNGPQISFIAVYNPSWASEKDETLEGAAKQILFFLTRDSQKIISDTRENPDSPLKIVPIGIQEQVHIVGVLQGLYALVKDFGTKDGPISVALSNKIIVIVEIEPNFFLACCSGASLGENDTEQINVAQTEALIKQSHRRFQLFNSSFNLLIKLYGREKFCLIVREHWHDFLSAVNTGDEISFGPRSLRWPTRLNSEGALLLLKGSGSRLSSLRLLELSKSEMEALAKDASPKISGWTVYNFNAEAPKENGLMYLSPEIGNVLSQEYVNAIHDYFVFLFSHGCLESEYIMDRRYLAPYFQLQSRRHQEDGSVIMENQSDLNGEEDEAASISAFGAIPASALELLHPVTLTDKLVILPLNTTVALFKNLGVAVSNKIVTGPDWLARWRVLETEVAPVSSTNGYQSRDEPEVIKGKYLLGLLGDVVCNFLVYFPTHDDATNREWREYQLVVYQSESRIFTLIYESGLSELADSHFYMSLKKDLFLPLLSIMDDCVSSPCFDLSNSVGSIAGPFGRALKGDKKDQVMKKKLESQLTSIDIDSDFFYIIYDTRKQSYQTSLPDLSTPIPSFTAELDGASTNALNASRHGAIFHLHNQLAGQFLVKSRDKIFFSSSASDEHLHKFASSKNNDWLFYAMKYKEKIIVIIKNYNRKAKPKAPLEPAISYLTQVADSVYGAANLGFLDNLGTDVKGWLGRLGSQDKD